MLRKKFSLHLLILFFSFSCVYSQNLNSNLVILCLAAHPDDEDNAALAYYVKVKGIKAYTIYFTRGEGGQNEIGPELYDELGKIRERETQEAAQIQGSTPLFLGFLDFGYSKTAKETFKMWGGKDSILSRLVYLIRLIRPDVIISNHDTITTKPNRQHGHHQAVGITVYEAFDKAADPNYRPEQFREGITSWQVKKLFFRVYDSTKTDGVVKIDIHQKDPASGKTIEDISFEAIAKHRSQGMDKIVRENLRSITVERIYELIRSDKTYTFDASDLFSGIEIHDIRVLQKLPSPVSFPTMYLYPHLSKQDSLKILEDVKFQNNIYIGLIKSYDNTLENTLNAFKIPFDFLDSMKLAEANLLNYTAIIIDMRAYFYRQDLVRHNDRLLSYVFNGVNLIVFYHKPGDWNNKNYPPYQIYITSERVTEEDSKVSILHPEYFFFKTPNIITGDDWSGWVQERSIYLSSDDSILTSNKYLRILSMSDENENQPSTSLLYAKYGKGTYTYVSLVLYRQLKIFNRGALKLFANMTSMPKNK